MGRQGGVHVPRPSNTAVELGEGHRWDDNVSLQSRRRLEQVMDLATRGMIRLDECLHSLGVEHWATHRTGHQATA